MTSAQEMEQAMVDWTKQLTDADLRVPLAGKRPYTDGDIVRLRAAILVELLDHERRHKLGEVTSFPHGWIRGLVTKRWSVAEPQEIPEAQWLLAILQNERLGLLEVSKETYGLTAAGRERAVGLAPETA